MHTLPDGVKLELLHQPANARSSGGVSHPPLLFLHGGGHAAWCWQVWRVGYKVDVRLYGHPPRCFACAPCGCAHARQLHVLRML